MSERNIEIAGWEIEELVRSDIQAKDEVFRLKRENARLEKTLDRMTGRYIAECSHANGLLDRAETAENRADRFKQSLDNDAAAFAQPYGETPGEAQKRCANGAILPDCPISDGAMKVIENLK